MIKKLTIIIALTTMFWANGQVFQGKAEYFSKRITKTKVKEAKSKEDEEFDKLGIGVGKNEVNDILFGKNPPQ